MKRIFTSSFALLLVLTFCLGIAGASAVEPRASLTIASYSSTMKAGSSSGQLKIGFDVTASKMADSLGVSSIAIYKADGTYVTTITGSTSNGLIETSSSLHKGTYTYAGTSQVSYYAKVTVFATVGSTSDSRTVTTTTVKAP